MLINMFLYFTFIIPVSLLIFKYYLQMVKLVNLKGTIHIPYSIP